MKRCLTVLLFLAPLLPLSVSAGELPVTRAEGPVLSRAEGFRMLWEPLKRTVEDVREEPFGDIPADHAQFKLLIFAKTRKILDDETEFHPDDPLHLKETLLWLLRSRNVDQPSDITDVTLPQFLAYYPLLENPEDSLAENPAVTGEELQTVMEKLDTFLRRELHTVSFYAEEFAGKRTAFGEMFDPAALTAAHRYLPQNTLVRVTHKDSGKSVTVRINDRGPYVDGRDMDLSLTAFEQLAPRGTGILTNVTFERLGDTGETTTLCSGVQYQRRLGRTVLEPGIPRKTVRGDMLHLSANQSFRVLQIIPPRGKAIRYEKWIRRGEEVQIHFVQPGTYILVLLPDNGRRQRFRTEVGNECY